MNSWTPKNHVLEGARISPQEGTFCWAYWDTPSDYPEMLGGRYVDIVKVAHKGQHAAMRPASLCTQAT